MTKLPPRLDHLSQRQIHQFYTIVKEELEKYGLYWEHLRSASRMRVVTEARWAIIHRLRKEMDIPPFRIANMLGMDGSTVRNALIKMGEKGTEYFEGKPLTQDTKLRTKRVLRKWEQHTS